MKPIRSAAPNLLLPWSSAQQDVSLFKRIVVILVILFVLVAVGIASIKLPEVKREKLEQLPPQLAKVIMKKKLAPKPKPKPKPKVKPKPKPKPKVVKKKLKAKPLPKPKTKAVKKARAKAARSGLMAMKSEFAAMQTGFKAASVSKTKLSNSGSKAKVTERSVIASKAKATSGGINTAKLSRDTGVSQNLAAKNTTQVAAPVAGVLGGTGVADEQAGAKTGSLGKRSEEKLRLTLERSKGSLYTIYKKALRKDPSLEGKVSFRIVIDADGSVSSVKILASELNNKRLESRLKTRIRLLNFGAEEVEQMKTNWEIDFLPY